MYIKASPAPAPEAPVNLLALPVQSKNTDAGGGAQAPVTAAPAPEAPVNRPTDPSHTLSVGAVDIYSRCHGARQYADVC